MPIFDRHHFYQHSHRLKTNDFNDPNVPEQYPPDLELEPIHLDIDLHVDVANETVSGTVTTTVLGRRNGPTSLTLNAVDFLDVEVKDSDNHDLAWQYDGHCLSVDWLQPFNAGEERRLAISYRVTKPTDGLYFSWPDEAYPDQAWYAATDHETERARHWLPCIDLPNVRTTLDIRLRAEDRFTILANGLLMTETNHGDGTKTAHWRLEQRCPSYLVCFAVGDFVRADGGWFENDGAKLELAYFCTREHTAADLERSFGNTGSMMAWMTRKLDLAFPYPKYYQFALPMLGGAMENISLVSWNDIFVLDEPSKKEFGWVVDWINLHEMAHSYFGDAVVVRDFAHAWLKESWATYMEQLWCEDAFGEDEAQFMFYDNATSYFEEADEKYQRPIVTRRFKSSWQMYDRHLYPGGACRLHTLRRELGDEVFWAGVHDYLKRYNGQVVETDDFRRVLEEHSGRSLGKFFDQWFFKPGYPDLKVSFKYEAKQKQGLFEIEQQQVNPEKGIPPFELKTELGWTIDDQDFRQTIELREAKQTFIVPMTAEPEQVRFDPGYKVLHKLSFNPGDPLLRSQLTGAKDVLGRILAAKELAKTGKRANIEAIVAAYADEPFWGAREMFATMLGEAGTEAAVVGLTEIIKQEQDPRVLPGVFRAAKNYRNQALKEAISARLAGELNPMARKNAYEALGAQRKLADLDLLAQGSQQTGFNGQAQSGAFRGLAASRHIQARELLLEAVPYGRHSNRVRPAIVEGLADLGQGLEKAEREQVIEALIDLLRDPWLKVHWQAAMGLANMAAIEAIPALEAYGRDKSDLRRVFVTKLIEKIRATDKEDGSAVKKQLEEVREKMRKLEDQVQKLQAIQEVEVARD